MFSKSSWVHLRIPFSWFLLPVFLFSLAISPNFKEHNILWVLIIVHLFLYPASNGYNSYFDKDEKSIGGLKNPPPVNKGLYYLALLFDLIALVLSLVYINTTFAIMILVYGAVSKAYSHPAIRLKKYAVTSWIITGVFQGLFTFLMCYVGINNYGIEQTFKAPVLVPGLLTSLMLWANYPMTQIYQHEEDSKRGDITLSIRLGIKGTFYFTGAFFTIAAGAFLWYFNEFLKPEYGFTFVLALLPVLIFFSIWFFRVQENPAKADYTHTMRLNLISSTFLNLFFLWLFLEVTQVQQYLNN